MPRIPCPKDLQVKLPAILERHRRNRTALPMGTQVSTDHTVRMASAYEVDTGREAPCQKNLYSRVVARIVFFNDQRETPTLQRCGYRRGAFFGTRSALSYLQRLSANLIKPTSKVILTSLPPRALL